MGWVRRCCRPGTPHKARTSCGPTSTCSPSDPPCVANRTQLSRQRNLLQWWRGRSILEHMFDMAEVRDELAAWVAELEPGVYAGVDALALLEVVSESRRLLGAAETLLAARVAETGVWRDNNPDRSAAHWLA